MNAADARDALANGDAADRLHAMRWMQEHTEMHMGDHIGDSNGMMPTPRTDMEIGQYGSEARGAVNKVDANFARQLERELAAMRERAEKAEAALGETAAWALHIEDAACIGNLRNELDFARGMADAMRRERDEVRAWLATCLDNDAVRGQFAKEAVERMEAAIGEVQP
jgi:hypothetical protein